MKEAQSTTCGIGRLEAARVVRHALDEARANRNELELLYSGGTGLLGETRYVFLWRVSQLERVCNALERCALLAGGNPEDIARLNDRIAELTQRGGQLRQEAHALLPGPEAPGYRHLSGLRRRDSSASGRQFAHAFA